MQTLRLPTTEIIILALVTILWAVVGEEGRIDPMKTKSHFNLSRTYLETGNKDLASEEHRMLKELDEELAEELHELIN